MRAEFAHDGNEGTLGLSGVPFVGTLLAHQATRELRKLVIKGLGQIDAGSACQPRQSQLHAHLREREIIRGQE
jgi:hypothetical protein